MSRARKICSHPSCPNLTPCADHDRQPWANSARDRKLATLTSGSQRQKRARYVIDSADTICALCGYPGATQCDHRVPLAHGGADDLSNLQAVHADCHAEKSARERTQPHGWNRRLACTAPTKARSRPLYESGDFQDGPK